MINKAGEEIEPGRWYNFGGNVSVRVQRNNRLSIRLDTTGEIAYPAGPASRDSLSSALYYGETPESYAYFAFGEDFKP